MYFLRGILEQNKGNNSASIRAFSSAIRIKPDMQWNTTYSPDAKPNFEKTQGNLSPVWLLFHWTLILIPPKVTFGSMVHRCFQMALLPFLRDRTLFKLLGLDIKPIIGYLCQSKLYL